VRNIAVVALTKNLADELGRDNIAVTCVHPGFTRTESRTFDAEMLRKAESNALRRVVDASEVATLIAFLASPAATLANGAIITANGGTPGYLWA
jgi:NAD(P)-dependent dehydrogenase (short-subunit alcohol dehydrogenase family)